MSVILVDTVPSVAEVQMIDGMCSDTADDADTDPDCDRSRHTVDTKFPFRNPKAVTDKFMSRAFLLESTAIRTALFPGLI
jgi:hypothetical protein